MTQIDKSTLGFKLCIHHASSYILLGSDITNPEMKCGRDNKYLQNKVRRQNTQHFSSSHNTALLTHKICFTHQVLQQLATRKLFFRLSVTILTENLVTLFAAYI
jgi:hypothetical protein